jgi:hypothetical protein
MEHDDGAGCVCRRTPDVDISSRNTALPSGPDNVEPPFERRSATMAAAANAPGRFDALCVREPVDVADTELVDVGLCV